jgi:hypothetical protein
MSRQTNAAAAEGNANLAQAQNFVTGLAGQAMVRTFGGASCKTNAGLYG